LWIIGILSILVIRTVSRRSLPVRDVPLLADAYKPVLGQAGGGQTLAKIALVKETRETMMVKDVECENVVYVPLEKSL